MHLELDTISPALLVNHFIAELGVKHLTFSSNAFAIFMSVSQTPTEIRNITRILARHFVDRGPYEIQPKDILDLFSAPSFSLCLKLLKAYILKNEQKMIRIFIEIWSTGISYEDFLHELDSSVYLLGIIAANNSQKIHQLLLRGWMCFAQGKTHSLDMMRLFLEQDQQDQQV